jgi:hypothetical protein
MSWTEKKPNISGNLIIDGTIEGDQIKSDTDLTVGSLSVSDSSSGTTKHSDASAFLDDSGNNYLQIGYSATGTGGVLFGDSGDNDAGSIIYNNQYNSMGLYTAGTQSLTISSVGYCGIGTTEPERRLHVYMAESSCTPSTDAALFLEGQTSTSLQLGAYWAGVSSINFGAGGYSGPSGSDFDSGQIQYSNYSRYMSFKANGSEKMRLNATGYLGIGTTNPNVKLTVKNGSSGTGAPSSATLLLDSSSSNYIQMGGSYTGTQGILFGDTYDNNVGFLTYNHTTNSMRFTTNAFERVRIDSAGNVGINTTAPTEKLDINADTIRLRTSKTPTSSTAQGYQGEICYDSNYMYICVAYNTWKRIPLETW